MKSMISAFKQKEYDSPYPCLYNLLAINPPMIIFIIRATIRKKNHPIATFTINHIMFKIVDQGGFIDECKVYR